MTLRALSLQAGLPEDACSAALSRPYERPERAIAQFLGVDAARLWPDRYLADGRRKSPQPKGSYSPQPRLASGSAA